MSGRKHSDNSERLNCLLKDGSWYSKNNGTLAPVLLIAIK
jgi:hypothetical protein